MITAAVYTRISQDREGEALGVARQREDCEALAASLGYAVSRVYTDNDLGASTRSRKRRPEYEAMLADAKGGQFAAIIAYSNSRLTRRPRELEDLIELYERHRVRLHTIVSGDDNLATADGRMVIRLKGSIDAAEAERIGERVARKAKSTREAGGWTGGPRPFGYEPDGMTVRESEAVAIREAYQQVLTGASLASVVREWNAAGLLTGRGGQPWTVAGVRELLKNARYGGLRSYRGKGMSKPEIVGAAAWPAIVPEETFIAVKSILTDPERAHGPRSGQRLLTGVARCGVCGGPVHGSGGSANNPVYRCATSSGHFVRKGAAIDDFVSAVMVARLSRADAADLLAEKDEGPDVATLRAEAQSIRRNLDEMAADRALGLVSRSQMITATEPGKARLAAIEAELAAAATVPVLAPFAAPRPAGEVWGQLDTDRKRAVIGILADVAILPAGRGRKGFDPDTVRIEWRT